MQYGPKIVTDSLVLALDAADNNSAPHNDLPVKQGCVTWLDGADDDVFSYSSGTLVSQWRDKSGNDNHVSQSTTSSQPTRNRTLNSKSVVDFDGSDDSLSSSNSLTLSSGHTMFAVTLTDAFSSDAGLISINNQLSNGITVHTGGLVYFYYGSGGYNTTQGVNLSTSYILTKVWTGATSGNRISYKDGTQGYSTGTMANDNSTGVLRLGQQTTYYNGYIAEIVIYNRELSQDEITKVHNYLQNKWNIKVSDSRWYSQTANGYTFGKGGDPVFYETNKGHFDFDGSDDRMDIPGSDRITYSTTEAWTHEIVIDPGSSGIATSWNGIFGGYLNVGGYWMFHNGGQLSWYDAIISGSGRLWYTGLYLGTDIPYDTITHITITHDGSAGFKVFINGVQQRSTTRTFETSYSADLKIIGAGDSNRYGTSKIYLFRNYSKQLSDAEILQNYNVTKARFT